MKSKLALPVLLLTACASADNLFFSGDLRTNGNVLDCGAGCTLGAVNTDGEYAQYAAFVASFMVSSPTSVNVTTYGWGGGTSVTDALSSNTSTAIVADEVSVKVSVEFVVVAVNVNVCDGP